MAWRTRVTPRPVAVSPSLTTPIVLVVLLLAFFQIVGRKQGLRCGT